MIPQFEFFSIPLVAQTRRLKSFWQHIAPAQPMEAPSGNLFTLEGSMNNFETTVKRVELIKCIKENMQTHQAIVEQAQAGYKKCVLEILEEKLAAARSGKNIGHVIQFQQPRSHMREYERVLKMLEMDLTDEITLSELQFAQYVLDDWGWKGDFISTNSQYSERAMHFMESSER